MNGLLKVEMIKEGFHFGRSWIKEDSALSFLTVGLNIEVRAPTPGITVSRNMAHSVFLNLNEGRFQLTTA